MFNLFPGKNVESSVPEVSIIRVPLRIPVCDEALQIIRNLKASESDSPS